MWKPTIYQETRQDWSQFSIARCEVVRLKSWLQLARLVQETLLQTGLYSKTTTLRGTLRSGLYPHWDKVWSYKPHQITAFHELIEV